MDERNLVTLKATLDRLGFGSDLNEVLEVAIKNREPSFLLGVCSYFDPPVSLSAEKGVKDFVQYILNFGHSKKTGTYKLHNYLAQLSTHNGIKRNQGFEINNDHYITAREAYHLLLGNAVLKQVSTRKGTVLHPQEKTDVWFKLNIDLPPTFSRHPLSTFYPPHGFSLPQIVDTYPFIFQSSSERIQLIDSLKKGTFPKVDMELGGRIEIVFLSVNPKMKTLDVYDHRMKLIDNDIISRQNEFLEMPKRVELSDYIGYEQGLLAEKTRYFSDYQNEGLQYSPRKR